MSDARIEKLEERVAWLEHHVTQQDKEMLDLSRRLDRAQAELLRLRERAAAAEPGSGLGGLADAAAERPPHY
jgi:SlyX protein